VRQRLTETSGGEGQPLDVHGKRLIDCYDQLVGILRNRLGQNHAHFLAQPRVEPSGSITWFTPLAGAVVTADALAPEERQRLKDRAERIVGDIHGVASDIQAEGAAGQMIADMLRAAAQLAPGAPLFSVDGKPVVALWGHRGSGASATDFRPSAPGAPAAAPLRSAAVSPPPITTAPHVPASSTVLANSHTGATPPKIAVSSDSAAGKRRAAGLVFALAAIAVLLALLWNFRDYLGGGNGDALARDLDMQIAQAEARTKVLETEIARRQGKGAPVKCVPESKK
jgi:hypothetical protein